MVGAESGLLGSWLCVIMASTTVPQNLEDLTNAARELLKFGGDAVIC